MTACGRKLWAPIDRLLPDDLFDFDHRDVVYKGRFLVIAQVLSIIFHIAWWGFLFSRADGNYPGWALLWPGLIVTTIALVNLWQFRRSGAFTTAAHLFGLSSTMGMAAITMVTGGFIASPIAVHWPLTIIFVFIIDSFRTTIIWTGIAMACWAVGLTVADHYAIDLLPQTLHLNVRITMELMLGIGLFITLGFFNVYQNHLVGRLHREREKALFTAAHDSLTGIANRKSFETRLEQLIHQYQLTGAICAVMLVDLDNFKPVNDRFGHRTGDQVLATIAGRIARGIRRGDLAARIGGDEFGVLLCDLRQLNDLDIIAEKLGALIRAPVTTEEGHSVEISASIGIAVIGQDGDNIATLIHNADQAMYRAKSARDSFCYHRDHAAKPPGETGTGTAIPAR